MGTRSVLGLVILALATNLAAAANGPDVEFGGLKWHQENTDKFAVTDGQLVLNRGRGWLRTDKEYGDFLLKIEWTFIDKGADSGIYIRSGKESGGANGWPVKGIQVQCMDNDSLASVFGIKGVKKNAELLKKLRKPAGEYNLIEIRCQGKNLEVKLNGEVVTTSDALEPARGYIGLQGEGGTLKYRRIELKELP